MTLHTMAVTLDGIDCYCVLRCYGGLSCTTRGTHVVRD